jgi:hypothetical protein
MGVVIVGRNDTGAVVVALAAAVPYVSDPTSVAEQLCWLLGNQRGFHTLILDGDSLTTVNALNQNDLCWCMYGQLVEDIRNRLTVLFGTTRK